jgi:hypothetical protein
MAGFGIGAAGDFGENGGFQGGQTAGTSGGNGGGGGFEGIGQIGDFQTAQQNTTTTHSPDIGTFDFQDRFNRFTFQNRAKAKTAPTAAQAKQTALETFLSFIVDPLTALSMPFMEGLNNEQRSQVQIDAHQGLIDAGTAANAGVDQQDLPPKPVAPPPAAPSTNAPEAFDLDAFLEELGLGGAATPSTPGAQVPASTVGDDLSSISGELTADARRRKTAAALQSNIHTSGQGLADSATIATSSQGLSDVASSLLLSSLPNRRVKKLLGS